MTRAGRYPVLIDAGRVLGQRVGLVEISILDLKAFLDSLIRERRDMAA